ncbi:MAG TPA: SRPBCC family protein [Bryobacteraceae bacterium]|nr:SRPBCC family protein [Bryobacteraceae bacterium]
MTIQEATYPGGVITQEQTSTRRDITRSSQYSKSSQDRFARKLGWFSIGLGAAEIMIPGTLGKMIGVRNHRRLMRSMGLREIAAGVGLLSQNRPADWMWTRVGGDMLDLALLGAAFSSDRSRKAPLAVATAAVAGITVLDMLCTRQLAQAIYKDVHVLESIGVNRPVEECYRFWRDFERLPGFMHHLESVRETQNGRSHWVAKAPAGMKIEWDAELTQDIPNQRIAWRSLEDAVIQSAGHVQFDRAPGGRGSIIRVSIHYKPPAGEIGAMVAKVFGEEPSMQVKQDLRKFKQMLETGEIPTTKGQPSGREALQTSTTRNGGRL